MRHPANSFPTAVSGAAAQGLRVRSFEVDINLKRKAPSQTCDLVRDRSNLNRSRSKFGGIIILAALGLAVAGPAPAAPPDANSAATLASMARHVDKDGGVIALMLEDQAITQADVAEVIRTMPASQASLGLQEVSRRALDVLVGQKAMMLNARKAGLDKDQAVIRRENAAKDRVLAEAWLTRQTDQAVTEQALRTRYDSEFAGKPGPDEVRARLILVPTADEARSIIGKAQAGAEFDGLARTYSKDPSAAKGGDLGYSPLEGLAPEIGPVVFALAPGQVTPSPVASPAGFMVLRADGRRQRAAPTFEEARPGLERSIRAEAARLVVQTTLAHIKLAPAAKP